MEELPVLLKFGHVDDEYVTFEWSAGGMVHVHMAFWIVGAPRIDKIEVPREKRDEKGDNAWMEIEYVPEGVTVVPESEAADRLAAYWDRGVTEFNVAKAIAGKEAAESRGLSG